LEKVHHPAGTMVPSSTDTNALFDTAGSGAGANVRSVERALALTLRQPGRTGATGPRTPRDHFSAKARTVIDVASLALMGTAKKRKPDEGRAERLARFSTIRMSLLNSLV
jgi:hypothetical protein